MACLTTMGHAQNRMPMDRPVLKGIKTTPQEKDYLDYLYRYMPMPDKTDYTTGFYLQNVRSSLRARAEMPWGKHVSEREFKHFVLPVRVNNENLDDSRTVFYDQLKERVRHLNMYQAILEVNHWCHEKATYRPSDGRTSSPMATVCTAYGRCGEESTLLVAALRAVGIPARQVYTPRWAHTDDNHAWVEAWADGKWYFLGACEPEPVLNLGWFNESASRGMLMHTKVFGDYHGEEEVVSKTPNYTEINVVTNYAPAQNLTVTILDDKQHPVSGADIYFKLYNYAEFFTVAHKVTDRQGRASLTGGLGDMIVWAAKDGKSAFEKVSFGKQEQVTLTLNQAIKDQKIQLDIVPPPSKPQLPTLTTAQRTENDRRLATEDSIREAYVATMKDESRGNHRTIDDFIAQATNKVMAHKLLSVLSAKDLRDVRPEVLKDHLSDKTDTSEMYCKYVMCPRVELEWLTPYRHFLAKKLADLKSPEQLKDWCARNISVDQRYGFPGLRMQPMSVYKYKMTDALGRNIFFVAAARSLGWPARIDEVTGKVQYAKQGAWVDVDFGTAKDRKQAATSATQGTLRTHYAPSGHNDNPKYYIHFTISKLVDGAPQLLNFPETATWKEYFDRPLPLDTGRYMLVTGTRMADGQVLSEITPFEIHAGKETTLDFTMRESKDKVQVIGSFNAENKYEDLQSNTVKSILSTTGRGFYVIALIAPNNEPTNHALRDISACKERLEKWGRSIVLLFENKDLAQRFNHKEFDHLPHNVVWGVDTDGTILKEIQKEMSLKNSTMPIFLICDSFNRVVFIKQGYTINLGEQLVKVISQL